jgi:hypothetical protein
LSSTPAASPVASTPVRQDVPQPPAIGSADALAWERSEDHDSVLQGSILPVIDPWQVPVPFSADRYFFVRGTALLIGQ